VPKAPSQKRGILGTLEGALGDGGEDEPTLDEDFARLIETFHATTEDGNAT
jgi:hypothetical protein